MVLLRLLLSRLRAENVRSEVADVTGNVNGMTNTSVKVFFGTKTRLLCPPNVLLRGDWGGGGATDPPLPPSPPMASGRIVNVVVGQWLSSVRFFTLAFALSCFCP